MVVRLRDVDGGGRWEGPHVSRSATRPPPPCPCSSHLLKLTTTSPWTSSSKDSSFSSSSVKVSNHWLVFESCVTRFLRVLSEFSFWQTTANNLKIAHISRYGDFEFYSEPFCFELCNSSRNWISLIYPITLHQTIYLHERQWHYFSEINWKR